MFIVCYLHPSESPTIALVSPVLDPTNYNSWSRSMFTALSAKNKVEFVDGTITRTTPLISNHFYMMLGRDAMMKP
uniref:Retrotransposon Copia-like N-terminal domain-containing protein n=1 Tax=Glycine max TaxID=3847 RepID=A0A0R0J6T7_SOYBN